MQQGDIFSKPIRPAFNKKYIDIWRNTLMLFRILITENVTSLHGNLVQDTGLKHYLHDKALG